MNTPTTEHTPAAIEATPFDDGALYDLFFERLDLGVDFYLGPREQRRGRTSTWPAAREASCSPRFNAGVDVEGWDLFPSLLARLRHKTEALEFEPRLHQANMAGFRIPGRYPLIMITFNAFVHKPDDRGTTRNAEFVP